MAIKVENTFVIPAPPERAFRMLTDLARIVPCVPGTDLTELLGKDRFRAATKLRVGPIELRFAGVGEFIERNASSRSATVRARGGEVKGRGTFLAEMKFAVTPHGKDQSSVRVATDVTLVGAVAQYGRGTDIVRELTQQHVREFANSVAALIEAERIVQAVAAQAARTSVPAPRAVETVGGAPGASAPKRLSVRAPRPVSSTGHQLRNLGPAAAAASAPVTRLYAFWNAVRAMMRRWFGARP